MSKEFTILCCICGAPFERGELRLEAICWSCSALLRKKIGWTDGTKIHETFEQCREAIQAQPQMRRANEALEVAYGRLQARQEKLLKLARKHLEALDRWNCSQHEDLLDLHHDAQIELEEFINEEEEKSK